jgi:hypothetical protein
MYIKYDDAAAAMGMITEVDHDDSVGGDDDDK